MLLHNRHFSNIFAVILILLQLLRWIVKCIILTVLSRPSEEPWPLDHRDSLSGAKITKIERTESERALLNFFLAKINKIDPDVIVGHDVASYDLDILLHRLAQNKADQWSRLGRLRRTNIPQSKVNVTIIWKDYLLPNAFVFKGGEPKSSCYEWTFGL